MKKYIGIIIGVSILYLPPIVSANNVVSETEHSCRFDRCQVRCANKRGQWITIGSAKKVKITIFSSGATKIVLDKGLDGLQTVVMGGDGYICSIENQKN